MTFADLGVRSPPTASEWRKQNESKSTSSPNTPVTVTPQLSHAYPEQIPRNIHLPNEEARRVSILNSA